MAALETVRKAIAEGDVDFLREGVRVLAQAVMETEVTELTGLPKGERDPERRLTSRNGYRERRWDTRVGTLELSSRASATVPTSPACSSRAARDEDVGHGPEDSSGATRARGPRTAPASDCRRPALRRRPGTSATRRSARRAPRTDRASHPEPRPRSERVYHRPSG